ncbi:hypothetical protein F2Q69_00051223 [Brassica cretica]|uniref:Uncharacterized protein n=1 Tax=Brassica cretica TaxID=69181 RepID=A0A8S9PVE2_BRACR|nr:hypothetical protein F2Q69_00051223 [Brassica cretica]
MGLSEDSVSSVSHGILGTRGRLRTLDDMNVSWLFQMVFFSQREGCCRRVEGDRLMRVCLCVIMRVYSRVEVQRTRYYKTAIFRGNAVWWWCQIEIDSGWKHVCFGFSAWDSVAVCFGFSGHMRGRTNGSTRYHGCRAAVQSDVQGKVFIQNVTKEILRMRSLVSTSY